MLTIFAKFIIKVENKEFVQRELEKLVPPTRLEEGCVDYILYNDIEDPSILLLYENWDNAEKLDVHMKSEHFVTCFERIDGMFEIEVHKASHLK